MFTARLIIPTAISLLLAALLYAEKQGVKELERQLALSQTNTQTHIEQEERLSAQIRELERLIADARAANLKPEARAVDLAATDPAAEPTTDTAGRPGKDSTKKDSGGFAKAMEKMFTDPDMKKMMQSQTAMVVGTMYGDLAKELHLDPDRAKQAMELLSERQMAISSEGLKLISNKDKKQETTENLVQSQKEYDKQLTNLLGQDGFTKFKDYERTMGERMQLNRYKSSFAANGLALDEKQSQGLLDIMKTERFKTPISPLDTGNKDVGAALKMMESEDLMDAVLKNQDGLNLRVLDRARNVLSADQMVQFEQIQEQQADMQRMGMKMGREMMKSK